ncbi:hypothetical protein BGX27_006645, partial [Mortierella sp. AM989]
MAPIISLVLMASVLMGAMSASISHDTFIKAESLVSHNSGFGILYNDHYIHRACLDIKYSVNGAFVAVNPAQFSGEGSSVCGKHVKVNRADDPSEQYTYRIIDLCKDCVKDEVEFSKKALQELSDSKRVAIDWEIVEAGGNYKSAAKPSAKIGQIKESHDDDDNDDDDNGDDD